MATTKAIRFLVSIILPIALIALLSGIVFWMNVSAPDQDEFVTIGSIPGRRAIVTRVELLLDANDIPNALEGSKAFGVAVRLKDRQRAKELIRRDSELGGYYLRVRE